MSQRSCRRSRTSLTDHARPRRPDRSLPPGGCHPVTSASVGPARICWNQVGGPLVGLLLADAATLRLEGPADSSSPRTAGPHTGRCTPSTAGGSRRSRCGLGHITEVSRTTATTSPSRQRADDRHRPLRLVRGRPVRGASSHRQDVGSPRRRRATPWRACAAGSAPRRCPRPRRSWRRERRAARRGAVQWSTPCGNDVSRTPPTTMCIGPDVHRTVSWPRCGRSALTIHLSRTGSTLATRTQRDRQPAHPPMLSS